MRSTRNRKLPMYRKDGASITLSNGPSSQRLKSTRSTACFHFRFFPAGNSSNQPSQMSSGFPASPNLNSI